MKYRPIGNTGLRASEIGFGCGDNAGLIVRATHAERMHAIERSLDLGINYFDTSPDYGKGLSEANLGRAFRELGRRPIISTKVELARGQEDDPAGWVVRSVEDSLKRLNMDFVDIVEIHNAPVAKADISAPGWMQVEVGHYLGPKGFLEGLEVLRRQGKVRFFGFACERAEPGPSKELLDTGEFSIINCWYDLLNPTSGTLPIPGLHVECDYDGILNHAYALGCGAAIIRPLAGGTLTDLALGGGQRHPYAGGGLSRGGARYQALLNDARSMAFLRREGSRTLAQAAVRFVLMHPGVTTALGGFSELPQIEEMVKGAEIDPLSEEDLMQIEMIWRCNFGQWTAVD